VWSHATPELAGFHVCKVYAGMLALLLHVPPCFRRSAGLRAPGPDAQAADCACHRHPSPMLLFSMSCIAGIPLHVACDILVLKASV
jgi:hypothetical protein